MRRPTIFITEDVFVLNKIKETEYRPTKPDHAHLNNYRFPLDDSIWQPHVEETSLAVGFTNPTPTKVLPRLT